MNAYVTALSSTMIGDNGVGNASSQLQMQITRDELNSTFTCKVNSTALVEPLTVDIKLDVHGKYACVRVTFPTYDQTSLSPKSESLKVDKRFFIDVSIDRNETENNPSELDSLNRVRIRLSGHLVVKPLRVGTTKSRKGVKYDPPVFPWLSFRACTFDCFR